MNQPVPNAAATETRQVRQTSIIDTYDGTQRLVESGVESVLTDATSGAAQIETTTILVRSRDGVLIDPATTPLYQCRVCGTGPLSERAVVFCRVCAYVCGRCCAVIDPSGPFCRGCYKRERRARILRWLFTIPRG